MVLSYELNFFSPAHTRRKSSRLWTASITEVAGKKEMEDLITAIRYFIKGFGCLSAMFITC